MPHKIYLAILLVIFISGCATHKAGVSNYELIDVALFENSPPEIAPDEKFSSIIIKRDNGFQASALPAKIYLDGLFLTNIKEGRYINIFVKPGAHTLLLKTNGVGLAPFSHELKINLLGSSLSYYRIKPGWPTGMQLSESED